MGCSFIAPIQHALGSVANNPIVNAVVQFIPGVNVAWDAANAVYQASQGNLLGAVGAGLGAYGAGGGFSSEGFQVPNVVSNPSFSSVGDSFNAAGNKLSSLFGGNPSGVATPSTGLTSADIKSGLSAFPGDYGQQVSAYANSLGVPQQTLLDVANGTHATVGDALGSSGGIWNNLTGSLSGGFNPVSMGISALSNLGSGYLNSQAAARAIQAQTSAATTALGEQQRQYNQNRADSLPWLTAGSQAETKLGDLIGVSGNIHATGYGSLTKPFSSADMAADPVYNSGLQFGLNKGEGAINARSIQNGSYDSGAAVKAISQYANDYGSTKGNEAFNRYNTTQGDIYNRLAGISGAGQNQVNQVIRSGAENTNAQSSITQGIGNANAAGIVGGANAWGTALQGINQNYQNSQNGMLLNQLGRNYNGSYLNG